MKSILKIQVLLFIFSLSNNISFAGGDSIFIKPTYILLAKQVSFTPTEFVYDIFIKHSNPSQTRFEYAGGQYFFRTTIAFRNGGYCTYRYTSDTLSDMPKSMIPRNPSMAVLAGTGDTILMRLAINTYPGAGNGYMVPDTGNGVRIIRMKFTNVNSTFNGSPENNIHWHNFVPNPYTKIFAYTGLNGTVNTEITDTANHFIDFSGVNAYPQLINPPNNSLNIPLTTNFNWSKIDTAQSYRLQVSTDSLFNTIIVNDSTLIDTFKIVSGLSKGTKYFWRVIAKSVSGIIYQSVTWKFTTVLPIRLNLTVIPEAMYFPLFNQLSRRDTVSVYLRSAVSPFSKIDSAKGIIDSLNFSGLFTFKNALSGTYFIVVKHFNSIETWSKAGGESLILDGSIHNYNFTNASTQAYGKNLKLKASKYCIYSGDVNQDGVIDGSDLIRIHTDAFNFVTGIRIPTDLNGDSFVDGTDYSIGDNNGFNFVGVVSPVFGPILSYVTKEKKDY